MLLSMRAWHNASNVYGPLLTYVRHVIMLTHRLAKCLMRLQWIVTRMHVLARRCRRWRQLPFDVRQRGGCLYWHIGEREPLLIVELAQDFVLAQIESIAHAKPAIKTTGYWCRAASTCTPPPTAIRWDLRAIRFSSSVTLRDPRASFKENAWTFVRSLAIVLTSRHYVRKDMFNIWLISFSF